MFYRTLLLSLFVIVFVWLISCRKWGVVFYRLEDILTLPLSKVLKLNSEPLLEYDAWYKISLILAV